MKIREDVRERLEGRLEELSWRFSETEDIKEKCMLNKEICRIEKILISLSPKLVREKQKK